jgi:hypothetical protein
MSLLGGCWESAGSLLGVCWESAGSLLGIFKMVSLEGSTNELSKLRPVRSLLRVLIKSAKSSLGVSWESVGSLLGVCRESAGSLLRIRWKFFHM